MKAITLILSISFISASASHAKYDISNYQSMFTAVQIIGHDREYIAIRKFTFNKKKFHLLADMDTLQTFIYSSKFLKINSLNKAEIETKHADKNYFKILKKSMLDSKKILNAGFKNFLSIKNGVHLTIDLCPSPKPLDKELFNEVIKHFFIQNEPVPIAIAVSGNWINYHKKDLQWLLQLQSNHKIIITWINHSYFHRVKNNCPHSENFLLMDGTNINFEILETEKMMLKNGIVPDLFFRFPGLVSNEELFKKVIEHGLIPLGSDAWLAKKQKPGNGSIILIHANGFDQYGINSFVDMMKKEKDRIKNKKWILHNIRQSLLKNLNKS